jgi:hypothetical protein
MKVQFSRTKIFRSIKTVEHPFELQIVDLQSIDFELIDLDDTAADRVVGGSATIAGSLEAGGTCFSCEAPRYPRRHQRRHPGRSPRVIPLITAENQPTPATGRFASQEAYEAYLNSPDFNPDTLLVI